MPKITRCEAKKMAEKSGWDFKKDFHEQNSSGKYTELLSIAKLKGYRKPKSSSGSTARAFFYYLEKTKNC